MGGECLLIALFYIRKAGGRKTHFEQIRKWWKQETHYTKDVLVDLEQSKDSGFFRENMGNE
jgi:hypothetical protein